MWKKYREYNFVFPVLEGHDTVWLECCTQCAVNINSFHTEIFISIGLEVSVEKVSDLSQPSSSIVNIAPPPICRISA